MATHAITVERIRPRNVKDQLRRTISLVTKGIRGGSTYFPIRQHAAAVAATAGPKDYMGQLSALYDDFTKRRWRYVKDPLLAEMVHVSGPAIWSNVWGAASGQGTGDCDCATSAFGAAAASIGFPVRVVTSVPFGRPRGPLGRLPGHIYPEIFVKGPGWIPADPVVYPQHGLGYASPAAARSRWDLWGKPIAGELAGEGEISMLGEVYDGNPDYDLTRYGYAGFASDGEPAAWETVGVRGFGAYADQIEPMGGFGLAAEVEPDQHGLVRTPMIELTPRDHKFMRLHGVPYEGMPALGDDGSVYQWNGLGGFFKKIFKGVKKLAHKAVGFAKKIIKKLPGGKYLVKFMDKLHKVAMKLIRPLTKWVGKYAAKLAPIAAMIPGYGPAISAALYAGGKIATLAAKYGMTQSKKGKVKFKDPKQAAAFRKELKQNAEQERADVRSGKKKPHPMRFPAGSAEHTAALQAMGAKPIADAGKKAAA